MQLRCIPRTMALLGAIALMVGWTASAGAQVTFHPPDGNVPGNPDENVLFNATGTVAHPLIGNPIFGKTNNTDQWVKIEGNESFTASGGQAKYQATDGVGFDFSKVSLDDPANTKTLFTWFQMNLDCNNNVTGATLVMRAHLTNGITYSSPAVALDNNGVNRYDIVADAGFFIDWIDWQATPASAVVDSIQYRIGGVQGRTVTAVPEPSSMALLAGGALPLFGFIRRRRR